MRKTAIALTLILALLASALAPFHFVKTASAERVIVPDDFSTIQEAVDNANDGDTVFVKSGTYYENVTVNKSIFLKGENPTSSIIKGGITVTAHNVTISSLTIDGPETWSETGIFTCGVQIMGDLHTTTAASITNCVITAWGTAIWTGRGDGNKIINNTLSNANIGIEIDGSDNIVSYNNIQTLSGGIVLSDQYMSNNLVFRNRVSAEIGVGVNWYNSENYIFENIIVSCTIGVHLGVWPEGWGPCSDNKIFHNNFIDNTQPTFVGEGSTNTWDDGYPSGGNYWSDHSGVDVKTGRDQTATGSDGIADTPHVIDPDNIDNYPLMTPFIIPKASYEMVDFTRSFRDNDGNLLYSKPSSFRLIFPNGTTSPPLQVGTYQIPTGITVLHSVVWQGTEIKPEEPFTFDSFNGNPNIRCSVYSLTIDPLFYDNDGNLVKPTSWTIKFPNGTTRTVSSTVTYNQTQTGWYSIINILFNGVNIKTDEVTQLTSNQIWTPERTAYIPPVLLYDVESNSIITELAFNETEQVISFLATGPEGTSGYAIIRIARTLADKHEDITIYLDDKPIEYALDLTEYAWILTINYTHSSHKIVITLTKKAQPPEPFPTTLLATAVAIVATGSGVSMAYYFRKRKNNKHPDGSV
jgi:nitrous oxidase accessory protein NosD